MKQRSVNRVLVAVGVGIFLLVVASHAMAVPSSSGGSATGGAVMLDPFSLKTVTVASEPSGDLSLRPSRLSIRIPSRPPVRSAFQPLY
jgi:hypothetical protein